MDEVFPDGRPIIVGSPFMNTLSVAAASILVEPTVTAKGTLSANLVIGTVSGEVQFYGLQSDIPIARILVKSNSPVTALAYGSVTNQKNSEIIAICADGSTKCVCPPAFVSDSRDYSIVFSQLIQANVTAAHILDVDLDGMCELAVFMTDRVVRTFRWSPTEGRLTPVNKWEVPCQISALSITESIAGYDVWVSQLGSPCYVCLPLAGTSSVSIVMQEGKDTSSLVIPFKSQFLHIMGSLINKCIVKCGNREIPLENPGWPLVGATSVIVASINVVVTLDIRGLALVYAYEDHWLDEESIRPLLRFDSMPGADRINILSYGDSVLLALANSESRACVHRIYNHLIKHEMLKYHKDLSI